jgi:hypothetical protein
MTQTTFSDFYPSVSVVGAKGSTTAPVDGLAAKSLIVISDRQNITYSSRGIITPSTQPVNFVTQKQNTSVVPVWTIKDGAGTLLDASLLSGGVLYTNLMINSQNLAWDASVGTISVTHNSTIAPDITQTADTVTDSDAASSSYIINGLRYPGGTPPIVAGETYYCSAFFLKTSGVLTFPAIKVTVDGPTAWCFINTNTGEVSSGVTVIDCGTYWYVQFTLVSGNSIGPGQSVTFYPTYGLLSSFGSNTVSATGTCVPWGFQIIRSTGHCSYIETPSNIRTAVLANAVTLAAADFNTLRGSTYGITVNSTLVDVGGLISDKISIVKVQDGAVGDPGDPGTAGDPGVPGTNNATLFLYSRGVSAAAAPTGVQYFIFATGYVGDSSGSHVGWTTTIPATTGQACWVIQAVASATTSSANISSWTTAVKLVEDGSNGAGTSTQTTKSILGISGTITISLNNATSANFETYLDVFVTGSGGLSVTLEYRVGTTGGWSGFGSGSSASGNNEVLSASYAGTITNSTGSQRLYEIRCVGSGSGTLGSPATSSLLRGPV